MYGEKQDLVVRRLEIIGEATKNLPNEYSRKKHLEFVVEENGRFERCYIHEYFGIEYNIIWDTAGEFAAELKADRTACSGILFQK